MVAECVGDCRGQKRLQKLEDSRLNIQIHILEQLDKIDIIDLEIQQITELS
jgi:hypothetical protein